MQLDETDRRILHLLQENARISNAAIARQVGLVPSAISQRVRKLEERGILVGYGCTLNARKLGHPLVAFVRVQTRESSRDIDTGRALAALPEALEVHRVVGDDCFIVKVRVRSTDALARFLDEKVGRIPSVGSTRTTIVLTTIKETTFIPLDADVEAEAVGAA